MVGLYVFVVAKKEHLARFGNVRKLMVKTGYDGFTGNKGAAAVRFNIDDSAFSFVNVHLESGQKYVAERLENLRQIYDEAYNNFSQDLTDSASFYHDYKFILGDTNFRINKSFADVVKIVQE